MARVMITCPETGKPIYTGISVARTAFEGVRLSEQSAACPECGQAHAWTKQDAYLESEEEAHQP